MLDIWDCSSPLRPSAKINAHQAEILSCSWNQFQPFVLATGGSEGLIRIWDIRKFLTPIFQLEVSLPGHFSHVVLSFLWFLTVFVLLIMFTGLPRCSKTNSMFASPLVYVGFGVIRFYDKVYNNILFFWMTIIIKYKTIKN